MNKAILVGRMTDNPEIRKVGMDNTSVVRFSVACQRSFENSNGERTADFINCVAWRAQADFIGRNFRKGNWIGIEGRLQKRKYDDQNGQTRTKTEVVVEAVSFVGNKGTSENTGVNSFRDEDIPVDHRKNNGGSFIPPQNNNVASKNNDTMFNDIESDDNGKNLFDDLDTSAITNDSDDLNF